MTQKDTNSGGPAHLHGWIILDKPVGPSSFGAVAAMRRILRDNDYGRPKIGHGGTLDPLASGVLPLALGEAVKTCGRLLDATKGYVFTLAFGTATDSGDAEGAVVARCAHRPDAAAIAAILPRFTGTIQQIPPAFSALKVAGKRAYDLARAGAPPDLPPREVRIDSLRLLSVDDGGATLDLVCSKGTYVRSLARDLAQALGTCGHVAALRRVRAGPFQEDQAISLDKLSALGQCRALERVMLPLAAGLDDILVLAVCPEEAQSLLRGCRIARRLSTLGLHLASLNGIPVALVEPVGDEVKVVRGFNLLDQLK